MFILKLQARDQEKLVQAIIQSPTRIKIQEIKCVHGYSLADLLTETKFRRIRIG